jgi:enoyl-CoA hydratase/carnithine racemase
MSRLEKYQDNYQHARLERRDGILQVTFHTGGGPLIWAEGPHTEFGELFTDISRDPDNKVVIITGTGRAFCDQADPASWSPMTAETWDRIYVEGKHLLADLLEIEVPMIAAINGPAMIHAEMAVLCDIVIASEDTIFQDRHFRIGAVPGDGVHIVWPALLGPNRGRYFLLTGQKLSAQQALALGVVCEVVPREQLLARAWELAGHIASQPIRTIRYARTVLVQQLKKQMQEYLGQGLAYEGLAQSFARPKRDKRD